MTGARYWKLKLARNAGTDVAKSLPAIEVAGHTFEQVAIVCGVRGTVSVEPASRMGGTGWVEATWKDWQEAEARARKAKAKADEEAARLLVAKRYGIPVQEEFGYHVRDTSTAYIVRATKAYLFDARGRRFHRKASSLRNPGGLVGQKHGFGQRLTRVDTVPVEAYLKGRDRADIVKERKAAGDANPEVSK